MKSIISKHCVLTLSLLAVIVAIIGCSGGGGNAAGLTCAWCGTEIPAACNGTSIYDQAGKQLFFANAGEYEAFLDKYTDGVRRQSSAGHGYYMTTKSQAYEPAMGSNCDGTIHGNAGLTCAWCATTIPVACDDSFIYDQAGKQLFFANQTEHEAFVAKYTDGEKRQGGPGDGYYITTKSQAYETPLGKNCDGTPHATSPSAWVCSWDGLMLPAICDAVSILDQSGTELYFANEAEMDAFIKKYTDTTKYPGPPGEGFYMVTKTVADETPIGINCDGSAHAPAGTATYTSAWSGQAVSEVCALPHSFETQHGTTLFFANGLERDSFIQKYTTGAPSWTPPNGEFYRISTNQAYETPLYGGTCDLDS